MEEKFSAVPLEILDSVYPKWKQVSYNFGIACWLTSCREMHKQVCNCDSFRNHWFQLEGRPVLAVATGTQTDPSPQKQACGGSVIAGTGARLDAAKRFLNSSKFKSDVYQVLEEDYKKNFERKRRRPRKQELLKKLRCSEETESDLSGVSEIEWSDTEDGGRGGGFTNGFGGGGIIKGGPRGGGIDLLGAGNVGTITGTAGVSLEGILSGRFMSNIPVATQSGEPTLTTPKD
ncbi:VP2 [Gyrovirus Tu243]|uniref:Dual specificity protein phosphatase VP2 n=1 Tax=Gyrovirus Tu243 TaxID=1415627 RepID=U5U733_9VIRU|nr:VP2 [Gyrovirus Tu243]AGZ20416.1 VP2 [Gyrovirus Tu243]